MRNKILCFSLVFVCFQVISADLNNKSNFNSFLITLGKIESSNNPRAYNKKENAIGIYQIRLLYFKDAQRINPELKKYSHNDCYNPEISKLVVSAYILRYSKQNNIENWAKCHNGGLNYYKKTGKVKNNLEKYYRKFI